MDEEKLLREGIDACLKGVAGSEEAAGKAVLVLEQMAKDYRIIVDNVTRDERKPEYLPKTTIEFRDNYATRSSIKRCPLAGKEVTGSERSQGKDYDTYSDEAFVCERASIEDDPDPYPGEMPTMLRNYLFHPLVEEHEPGCFRMHVEPSDDSKYAEHLQRFKELVLENARAYLKALRELSPKKA